MNERAQANIQRLECIANHLGPLLRDFVFVGGCTVGLHITDPIAPDCRPTYDVDAIVDVISIGDYHKIEKKLRDLGFTPPLEIGAPICSWSIQGIRLDIMPTKQEILGFGNPWYMDASKCAVPMTLANGLEILVISSAYFIATKLSAYSRRGNNDIYASHDLEDIIAVIDGRDELFEELINSPKELKAFIKQEIKKIMNHPDFTYALPGHIIDGSEGSLRLPVVVERMGKIANLKVQDN